MLLKPLSKLAKRRLVISEPLLSLPLVILVILVFSSNIKISLMTLKFILNGNPIPPTGNSSVIERPTKRKEDVLLLPYSIDFVLE